MMVRDDIVLVSDVDDTLTYPSPYQHVIQRFPGKQIRKVTSTRHFLGLIDDAPVAPWASSFLFNGIMNIVSSVHLVSGRPVNLKDATINWFTRNFPLNGKPIRFTSTEFTTMDAYIEQRLAFIDALDPDKTIYVDDAKILYDKACKVGIPAIYIHDGRLAGMQNWL